MEDDINSQVNMANNAITTRREFVNTLNRGVAQYVCRDLRMKVLSISPAMRSESKSQYGTNVNLLDVTATAETIAKVAQMDPNKQEVFYLKMTIFDDKNRSKAQTDQILAQMTPGKVVTVTVKRLVLFRDRPTCIFVCMAPSHKPHENIPSPPIPTARTAIVETAQSVPESISFQPPPPTILASIPLDDIGITDHSQLNDSQDSEVAGLHFGHEDLTSIKQEESYSTMDLSSEHIEPMDLNCVHVDSTPVKNEGKKRRKVQRTQ